MRPRRPGEARGRIDRRASSIEHPGCASTPGPDAAAVERPRSADRSSSAAAPRSLSSPMAARTRPTRTRWKLVARTSSLLVALVPALLVLVLAVSPASAVRVPVTNCLSDSYQSNTPALLQWEPLFADARFDTQGGNHNLQLIVWGNVTGSWTRDPLPGANDPYWTNPNKTNGKIIETPDPDADDKKATTLYRRVNVLSYEPWHEPVNFCKNGLVNASCPLGPVFRPDDAFRTDGLPSVNMSHDFSSSYAFSSFAATMLVIYGDAKATNIGCMSATLTPDLGTIASVLKFLPLVVLLFLGAAVIFASVFSPWGTTNIFHWTSNYGRDADLLRLVTPGFGDCLQYIQFIVLTGGLSLNYPGYYQPVVSQAAWSSLMFNQSVVTGTPAWQNVVDGIYVTNSTEGYGLHQLGQLVGMAESADIWPGMMVWLCLIVAGVFVLVQGCFVVQWLWRRINNITEEDLRAKNIPFSIGNVVRTVFSYMLMPIVALSTFQLVVAPKSPPYTVALAVVTLVLLMASSTWILSLIIRTRPKSVLFDDLPTVLRYGPLYNTYSDEVASFALVPVLLNFIRGIAIGAVQPSGVAQVVLLAICEVIQIFTLHAFRPFHPATSMNAYHTLFSALRALTILLMVAFVPSLGVTEGPKGWIGYAILLIHGCVLFLGFFLSALQTMVEVIARSLGAGGDDVTGFRRGGLAKIFGMRQLSRRETHRAIPSRTSQLSTVGILDMENGSRGSYVMAGGRVHSGSSVSFGFPHHRHRSSSALDSIDMYTAGHRHGDHSVSSHTPGTPGETTFSFLASPTMARQAAPTAMEASDPYYRPPRRRYQGSKDLAYSDLPRDSMDKQAAQPAGPSGEAAEASEEVPRGATPAPPSATLAALNLPSNRPDYATREVDFYYGVRGPALNSEGLGRKLGTGPADPTGPVATATGWFRNMFMNKTKEKGKGFEVVRSSRMPPGMARNGGYGDETPPEGIPVAMGVIRSGPIDSDDEDDKPQTKTSGKTRSGALLTDAGDPGSDAEEQAGPVGPVAKPDDETSKGHAAKGAAKATPADDGHSGNELEIPAIPRKSSKRNSAAGSIDLRPLSLVSGAESAVSNRSSDRGEGEHVQHQSDKRAVSSRLPFVRSDSAGHLSSRSSVESSHEFSDVELQEKGGEEERPASFGTVPHHGISRVDPDLSPVDLLSSSAELVREGSVNKR
ncbi:hypothetical protein HIM_03875 [Hirsutella minnesotensis 3608]|uniref:ML-like domain-containing protein n=1 Tax=Hirsutella minnesotensis 3608 TaxID=1043627 RepID=A0A0F8A665_9HYPO|nr:hypothetical protein HIM_03875 [Hirsutella minnesotensis 3608]